MPNHRVLGTLGHPPKLLVRLGPRRRSSLGSGLRLVEGFDPQQRFGELGLRNNSYTLSVQQKRHGK